MKKLVVSVLLALALAFLLSVFFMLCISPIICLSQLGLFSISEGSSFEIAKKILVQFEDAQNIALPSKIIALIFAQIALFLLSSIFSVRFFFKTLKIYLPNDAYFRSFYKFILILAFFVPAAFMILALFLSIPIPLVIGIVGAIAAILTIFASAMVLKVLPDAKASRRREIFKRG